MTTVNRDAFGQREDRLMSLAAALEQLTARIRTESADVATALALRERFGSSLADIQATQALLVGRAGRTPQAAQAAARLNAAMAGLTASLTAPLPEADIIPLSRPAARRAQIRAGRLDASTREMLGAIGKALAVGATAAALYATPAAAGCVGVGSTSLCDGDLHGGVSAVWAPTDALVVQNLTTDITPAINVAGLQLTHYAPTASGGGAWSDGDGGDGSRNLSITVTDPDNTIFTTNKAGVIVVTRAGNGGSGGDAGVGGSGGDGGDGGTGGSATANVNIDIQTVGADAHGVVAISNGGGGGGGGDFAVGVGSAGDGGKGGAGGAVTVNLGANSITTNGASANGIFASSLGGYGGNAGSCDVAICGGSGGGNSAIGGTVSVTTAAGSSILTYGGFSKGIRASSIGGFAGNGGDSYFAAGFASNGGSAGDGGAVYVTNGGSIVTGGVNSDAIFAQSIGGGGGDGGDSGISIASLGGSGSQGGNGGLVEVVNGLTGSIETSGDFSRGIYAQSVGGGGGSGGTASSIISIGGDGSNTSNGGTVRVTNRGLIVTHGLGAQAIFAQSVGGGGGSGGGAGGLVAVGGSGGGGGDGGAIEVTNSGALATGGADAAAIYAQSIGGGGGDGGNTGALASVGGKGGDGGDSSTVTVTSGGSLHTVGDRSTGIFAQSVGGGGGAGGGAASLGLFLNLSIGGSGGKGGDSDAVTVTTDSTSDIRTEGERSAAIFAQSVGGGGGAGGYGAGGSVGAFGSLSIGVGGSGGDGGDGKVVTVNADGYLQTLGADSQGIFAQSIGGGGGTGGFAIAAALAGGKVGIAGSVAVGGSGGKGGDSALVTVGNAADIDTTGDRSTGVFAQSVGGGGGAGGWSGALAAAGGVGAGAISVSVGGSAGDGGDGGVVDVTNSGQIHTLGADAHGLLAQSVGGGGGTGGFSVSAAVAGGKVAVGVGVAIGGGGGLGGDGDTVDVRTSGVIVTEGDRSSGVFAQSVGGGGGNGGWSGALGVGAGGTGGGAAITVGGWAGGGGDGKAVTVTSDSDIGTGGIDAHGLLAQSIGGGGGTGGFSLGAGVGAGQTGVGAVITVGGGGGDGGDGGIVKVTSNGDIVTHGDGAMAVNAQSIGGGGGNGGFTGALAVGAGTTGAAVTVGIGGFGGVAGDGEAVTLTSNGQVFTTGVEATGLFAQSIGGGGGNGGFAAALGVAAGTNAGAGNLTIGGFGGAAGDGGVVTLTSTKSVLTYGDGANGIQAQSLGGGGGNGGLAASMTAAFSSTTPVALGLNLGGFGAAGGDGEFVSVTSTGGVETRGDDAHAIFAQSVGGGGGTGGFSIGGVLSAGGTNTIAINANVGGFGGAGGKGGDVFVEADDLTVTRGAGSNGIFAQSVGGSGGDGGWAGSLTGSLSSTKSVSLGMTLGGTGGTGGLGGDVDVISHGQILTEDNDSHAIFAQSVGGGGGTGGFAIGANLGNTKSVNIVLTLGGSGGGAGVAGDVSVTVEDTINTKGDGSIGVFAQSVGGGGGAGGAAGALAFSNSESVNLTTNMGGLGGNGTVGGLVEVGNSGSIWTTGEGSHGIFAQSVGGGGGHGGMAGIDETEWSEYLVGGSASVSFGSRSQNISIAMGGSGGAGNDGGEVEVVNTGAIQTDGAVSHVIYAQSVGGGGGDAGVATAASGAFGAGKNGTYSVAMGGFGNTAGDGKLVTVDNSGALRSLGDGSIGIFAQSVGGGGGAGGDARGYSMSFSPSKAKGSTSVSVSLGGYAGAAGDGGEVDVDNSGLIYTSGAGAYGVYAQSVGGGGGTGGLVSTGGDEIIWVLDKLNKGEAKGGQIAIGGSGGAAGDGGLVTVDNSGVIVTLGQTAHGIIAQSVGGGGGNGGSGLAGEVSIGGQGGAAGDGGEVKVVNSGSIITEGDLAKGIIAQSIGGGGGIGGATDYDGEDNYSYRSELAATMNVVGNLQGTVDLVESFITPAFGIGIGGFGGAAGDGGLVTVENSGSIHTYGDFATGIFAQSVGGGGGMGGEGVFTGVGQVVFSGLGGSAGDGGDVIVTNTGAITTEGFGAYGIFAQSVGGGGGMAGDYSLGIASWGDTSSFGGEDYSDLLDLQLNPFHAGGGDGGDVTVTNTGAIRVNGVGAVGIFAQSVGGGGGLFGGKLLLGFIGSTEGVGEGGKVTVIQNGDVIVTGKNAIGALFQSASKDGDDDITATLNGAVKGGSVYGMGVLMDGGKTNRLTLNGLTWADSNLAVTATGGDDTVIANKGIIGNIDLGLGTNAFTNTATSFFLSLDYVKLNGGRFTNSGLLTPGDVGTVQVTRVAGAFTQTASGSMITDLDLLRTGKTGEIDRLDISGLIDIQGKFVLNILNPGYALPGDHTVTILNGSTSLVSSGLVLDKPISAVAGFQLVPTSQDLNLNYKIDFSPSGLNGNQTALGDHINDIQLAGSSPTFAPIAAELFYVPTVGDLANIYDSFSPQAYGGQMAAQTFASQQFADSMFSCPRTSAGVSFSEAGCVWVKPQARWLELSATSGAMAYHEQSTGLAGGFEVAVGDGAWRIGGAISGETVGGGVQSRTHGEGDRFQGGLVAKRDTGGLSIAFAVHGGTSGMDTRRMVLLPSGVRYAEGEQEMRFVGATARLAYRWGSDAGYVKPMIEVAGLKVETDGFTETGAGALNLVVPDQDDSFTRVSAKIEAGAEFKAGGAAIRPFTRIGFSHSTDAESALFAAAFEGAPPAAAHGFTVNPGLDATTFDAELGVSVVGPWASGRLTWTGQFGDRTDNQTLSLKLAVPF